MKANVILVDFENVQPTDFGLLKDGPFKVKVFLGSNQTKVPVSLAAALQTLGPNAEYIVLESVGKNALDFHIAYYLGQLVAEDKSPYFHLISKDTGFDALVKHLKSKKVSVQRSVCIGDIPYFKPVSPLPVIPSTPPANVSPVAGAASKAEKLPSTDPQIEIAIADLMKRKSSRPRTEKTLLSTLNALFKKELSEKQLAKLLLTLRSRGVVKFDGTKVSYNLPAES